MIQKKFTGKLIGRDNKYEFSTLKPGSCIIINSEGNINKFRHCVSAALYQWKKYNGYKWDTAVRIESNKIYVYRVN